MSSWGYEAVFYQIYPLGLCGAPFENDGVQEHRILKVLDWADHIAETGCNAVYFSPVFESDTHGYNTRDYCKIDCRLGTNEDFKKVCDKLHENGFAAGGFSPENIFVRDGKLVFHSYIDNLFFHITDNASDIIAEAQ